MSDGYEQWLRAVCFQKPTPEAYDLAKDAWNAGRRHGRGDTVMVKPITLDQAKQVLATPAETPAQSVAHIEAAAIRRVADRLRMKANGWCDWRDLLAEADRIERD